MTKNRSVDSPSPETPDGHADTPEGSEGQGKPTETAPDPVFGALAQLASSEPPPNAWVDQVYSDSMNEPEGEPDLEGMTAKDLKVFAAEQLGIIVPANWGKAKTLDLIETHRSAVATPPPEPDYEPASPRG